MMLVHVHHLLHVCENAYKAANASKAAADVHTGAGCIHRMQHDDGQGISKTVHDAAPNMTDNSRLSDRGDDEDGLAVRWTVGRVVLTRPRLWYHQTRCRDGYRQQQQLPVRQLVDAWHLRPRHSHIWPDPEIGRA